jgi:Lar family restriction alleviation protein
MKKKETALKPCPFCGEDEQQENDNEEGMSVRCGFCGALGPWADTRTNAEKEWNWREK